MAMAYRDMADKALDNSIEFSECNITALGKVLSYKVPYIRVYMNMIKIIKLHSTFSTQKRKP